jgi:ferritin-like metal-binding protein YciE
MAMPLTGPAVSVSRLASDQSIQMGRTGDAISRSPSLAQVRPLQPEIHRHYQPMNKESHAMAESGTLHDAFLDELKDAYDAEKQLTKALPKLAKAATSPELRAAFETHLEETRGHVDRLERVFEALDERAKGKHCDGIAGIIEEGSSVMGEDFDDTTMDACLIAGGQRAEHYEIAAYGTLVAWAKVMGHTQVADLLEETLNEEKSANEKLTKLAEGGINQQAADAVLPNEEPEEPTMASSKATAVADRRKR